MSKLDLTKINYDRFVIDNYKGMEFTYKRWLSLEEQRAFIDVVLEACISDDGYSEVLKEYAIRTAFITFYTDIDLTTVAAAEVYLYGGLFKEIFYQISRNIDGAAYEAMIAEINNKIEERDSIILKTIRGLIKELDSANIKSMISELMQGIQNPEIMKLIQGDING